MSTNTIQGETVSSLTSTSLGSDSSTSISQPLGTPLPWAEHACSVSLPTWAAVVGYEEGDVRVTEQMKCGYPRFVYHPYVLLLMETVLQRYRCRNRHEDCLVLPSVAAAVRCRQFLLLQQQPTSALLFPSSAINEMDNAWLEDDAIFSQNSDWQDKWLDNPISKANDVRNVVNVNDNNNNSINPQTTTSTQIHFGNPRPSPRIRIVAVRPEDFHTVEDVTSSNTTTSAVSAAAAGSQPLVYAVFFPAETWAGSQAKAYWQHGGEVVSSRRAQAALKAMGVCVYQQHKCPIGNISNTSNHDNNNNNNNNNRLDDKAAIPIAKQTMNLIQTTTTAMTRPHDLLRERIAGWAGVPDAESVFLTPSGMASIYTALRSARRYQMNHSHENPATSLPRMGSALGGTSIVYGFPYLDTLKLCSRPELSPAGVEFFGKGDAHDLHKLQLLMQHQPHKSYSALLTEVPSNPLLQCPDLIQLRALADQYDFCLIVDDTISNFLNVDVITTGLADAVCTSLTKLISGRGDVMGGSVVTNPYTAKGRWMQHDLMQRTTQTNMITFSSGTTCQALFEADATTLLDNSNSFVERNATINATAEALADWFEDHPDVATVYYPKQSAPLFKTQVQKPSGGYGGLMSILLNDHHQCQRTFYDALDVAKGPSLGTNFTLVCPYTLLAHYHELDFAMQYNVAPNLIRIAVGLEHVDILKDKIQYALNTSRLHPQITMMMTTRSSTCTTATSNNNNNNSNSISNSNKNKMAATTTSSSPQQQQQQVIAKRSFCTSATMAAPTMVSCMTNHHYHSGINIRSPLRGSCSFWRRKIMHSVIVTNGGDHQHANNMSGRRQRRFDRFCTTPAATAAAATARSATATALRRVVRCIR